MSVQDNRKKYDVTIKQIESLKDSYVLVGFQEGTVTRSQTKNGREKEVGLNMAQIAAQNEFGTDEIPRRPFLRPAIDNNIQLINRAILRQYDKIVDGQVNIKTGLDIIGLLVTKLIHQQINSTYDPPNSSKTIAIKKSSHPLIDFGQMRQSVRHKVIIP